MRELRVLLVAAAVVLAFGACAFLLSRNQPRPGITRDNFERIQEGMTTEEVEEILGGPAGRYTDRPIMVPIEGIMFRRWWIGDTGVVTIELTSDEPRRVRRKRFAPVPPGAFAEW
jgi:hypothetical protein